MEKRNCSLKKQVYFLSFLIAVVLSIFTISSPLSVLPALPVFAQSTEANVNDLKSKIQDKNNSIQLLQKEIDQYKTQIDETGKQANSLKNVVQSLTLTQQKLSTDLQLTSAKIDATNYTIDQLNAEIAIKEASIARNQDALARILRSVNENDSMSLLETLLTYKSTSAFWSEVESLIKIKDAIRGYVGTLNQLKADLQVKNQQNQEQKNTLTGLQIDLTGKKKVVEVTKQQQADLLAQTKSKQANYQKILEAKIALQNAFEQELVDYQSQLNFAINVNNLPHPGSGVLAWPLDQVTITQYFGDTAFAHDHPQVYNGHGHNGIDLRAAIGTTIKSAGDGVVAGTGNTDLVCSGASYGRWILVTHNNGLSTLYGHLSAIIVNKGQQVSKGEAIGYSGQSGYATGPHLHFTVFATEGMRIMALKSKVCPGTYVMPVGDLKSYLNPLSYL
jgi:murein DD-endopeptidase MepM/ murein hydrolase activator NlpD